MPALDWTFYRPRAFLVRIAKPVLCVGPTSTRATIRRPGQDLRLDALVVVVMILGGLPGRMLAEVLRLGATDVLVGWRKTQVVDVQSADFQDNKESQGY